MHRTIRSARPIGAGARLLIAGIAPAARALAAEASASATLHVSERGKDSWSGALPAPNAAGTDGPFATPSRARDEARRLRAAGGAARNGDVLILVHAGRYELAEPLVFTPEDSGTAASRTVLNAAPGDEGRAVLSRGRAVSGWKPAPGPRGEWVADVPGLKDGWRFRHVSVDGRWRSRPKLPDGETATYTMAGLAGADPKASYDTATVRFEYAPGQIDRAWTNLRDVEVVVPHFWTDSHLKVAAVDPDRRVVTLDRPSHYKFTDEHQPRPGRYYLTNVYEALKPGQFYANTSAGTLHYLPREGESRDRTRLVAPRLASLVEFRGDPASGRFVEHVVLRGLTLSDAAWEPGPRESMDSQASSQVPGAVIAVGARHVAIEDCTLRNLAGYAIDLREGCRGVRLAGNELAWIGAGGIKVNGAVDPEPLRTGETVIADNRIRHLGRLFHSGVGVLMMHSFGNTVAHNEIADLYYTGISVGWVWGYTPSVSRDNRIQFNRIHHVGQGLLSDLAAVYTLGLSPGTVVRNNLVHDVAGHDKGWGLYTDEGSTGIILENNLVYRTTHGGFHQHYGRDNVVRNNIFAFGRDAQVVRSRDEPHRSFTFERNLVAYRTGELFSSVWSGGTDRIAVVFNLYWNPDGGPKYPAGDLDAWRARGFDRHSLVADPRFEAPDKDDFRLRPDSPAIKLGFRPLDLSSVGPRASAARDSSR